jgi:hypothetical protein
MGTIQIKKVARTVTIGKYADTYRYVMKPELYACRK